MTAEAYCLHRVFEAAAASTLCVEQHYLVYVASGRLRLTHAHRTWTLAPARAALIAAATPIEVELPRRVIANSALFDPKTAPAPAARLSVFEVSPLLRQLLFSCRSYTSPSIPLDDYGQALFRALRAVAWRSASSPSPAVMPRGRSAIVTEALYRTQANLVSPPSFADLCAGLGTTPRSLSRHFASEIGMTWRECLQRMRMIRVVERLVDEPDAPVTEIALAVGYNSLSAFNAAFRKFSGMAPSEWRVSFSETP